MGSDQSTSNSSKFRKTFFKEYTFLTETRDAYLGFYQLYKHKTQPNTLLLLKSLPLKGISSAEIPKNFSTLAFSHKNFLKIMNISSNTEEFFCGDNNKLTIYSEFYGFTLAEELIRREKAQEFFTENEIWYLLNNLIESGDFLQRKLRISYGSFIAETVFLSEKGEVKLINPLVLQGFKGKMTNFSIKSDVYAVGLIVLYAGSLVNTRDLLNYKEKNGLLGILSRLLERYSQLLVNFLGEMMQENEENRPDFQELHTFITKPNEIPIKFAENCRILGVSPQNERKIRTSPQITRVKAVFVTPQRVFHQESSPTVKYVYETPFANNYEKSSLEKFRENYEEIQLGLQNLDSKIEKALEKSYINIKIYEEI